MKHKKLKFGKGFRVAIGNAKAQAAEMVLEPGDREGDPKNRHRGSDQWLFVHSGTGKAIIKKISYPLEPGSIFLIEKGDLHEIRNTGKTLLKTLNIYLPPAYTRGGNPLPRGRRRKNQV